MIAATRIQQLQTRIARFDDQQAYRELYTSLYPSLYHFILEMIKSRQIAEEIISDVFIKIWEKRKALEEIHNLRVYCFVAAKNLTLNQLEKQKRTATCNLDEYAAHLHSMSVDPEQMMITAEMFRRLNLAIQELPPKCRLIFKLIKEDGLSYKEVAHLLQLSPKTIENQMTIALKRISESIRFDLTRLN